MRKIAVLSAGLLATAAAALVALAPAASAAPAVTYDDCYAGGGTFAFLMSNPPRAYCEGGTYNGQDIPPLQ